MISFYPFTSPFAQGQKIKAMDNRFAKPLKEGKSVRIPPKRGQIKVKIFERVVGVVASKNWMARVQTSPEEGGSGNGGGHGGDSGSGGVTH